MSKHVGPERLDHDDLFLSESTFSAYGMIAMHSKWPLPFPLFFADVLTVINGENIRQGVNKGNEFSQVSTTTVISTCSSSTELLFVSVEFCSASSLWAEYSCI